MAGVASSSDGGATEALATGVSLGDGSSARARPAAVRPMTQRPRSTAIPKSRRDRILEERTAAPPSPPPEGGIGPPSLVCERPMMLKGVPRSARFTDYSSARGFGSETRTSGKTRRRYGRRQGDRTGAALGIASRRVSHGELRWASETYG